MNRQERAELARNQEKARKEAAEIAAKLKALDRSESLNCLMRWKLEVDQENRRRGLQC